MKPKRNEFQPKPVDRAYLYACEHCGWLNLVALDHARVGPRKGYSLEMLRITEVGSWAHTDRGTRPSSPGHIVVDNNGKKWQNGSVYHARCGRPLLQDPQATDLFWPDDARQLMNTRPNRNAPDPSTFDIYCKSAHFNQPRLLKELLTTAIVSADRLGGQDAVLLMLREAMADLRITLAGRWPFNSKYEGWVPIVMPMWVSDGHFETVAKTWGEVKG